MIGTYAATVLVCASSRRSGRRHRPLRGAALVLARSCARARPALRGLLGDGAAAGRRPALGARVLLLAAGSAGFLRGRLEFERRDLLTGCAVGAAGVARGLDPLRRRGALRDPRHRLQPRHVSASVERPTGSRPARGRAPAAGLPAGPALDRRRPAEPSGSAWSRVRRAHRRRRDHRLSGRAQPPSPSCRRCGGSPLRWSSAWPTWSPPTTPRAPSRRRCRRSSCSPSSLR